VTGEVVHHHDVTGTKPLRQELDHPLAIDRTVEEHLYSCTAYTAQGSTYDTVFVDVRNPLLEGMADRTTRLKLFYTSCARPRRQLGLGAVRLQSIRSGLSGRREHAKPDVPIADWLHLAAVGRAPR
jgi:hypothetical protein